MCWRVPGPWPARSATRTVQHRASLSWTATRGSDLGPSERAENQDPNFRTLRPRPEPSPSGQIRRLTRPRQLVYIRSVNRTRCMATRTRSHATRENSVDRGVPDTSGEERILELSVKAQIRGVLEHSLREINVFSRADSQPGVTIAMNCGAVNRVFPTWSKNPKFATARPASRCLGTSSRGAIVHRCGVNFTGRQLIGKTSWFPLAANRRYGTGCFHCWVATERGVCRRFCRVFSRLERTGSAMRILVRGSPWPMIARTAWPPPPRRAPLLPAPPFPSSFR